MAKLIAAACPKCGANVQIDPLREVVICNYCGTSSFVQSDRRPATQQFTHGYPVIHLPARATSQRAVLLAVLVVASLAVVLGGAFGAYLAISGAASTSARAAQGGAAKSDPLSTPFPSAVASDDFLKDATSIPKRLSGAIGTPLKGTEMEIFPDRVVLKARDPKNLSHMDEYTYSAGEVSAPKPIAMSAGEMSTIESKLFDVNAIAYDKVPFMVQDTLNVVQVEDGKVIYLFIEMGASEPRIRVYVTSPRVSAAYAEYSFKGERRMFMK